MKQIFTPKDAALILRDTPIDIRSTREDDIHTTYATAMMMAIEALEAAEKYRWHDLRKDPDDLPQYNHDVLVCCENEQGERDNFVMRLNKTYGWLFQARNPRCNIIAWKEIEPFGGEDDAEIH